MSKIRLSLLLLFVSVSLTTIASSIESADYYLRLVKEKGAKFVVREELGNWHAWDRALDKIQTGENAWVQLAISIREGTDAAKTTGLIVALAHALPNNPAAAITAVNNGFNLRDVCGFPFIEPTSDLIEDHFRKSISALDSSIKLNGTESLIRCKAKFEAQYARIKGQANAT